MFLHLFEKIQCRLRFLAIKLMYAETGMDKNKIANGHIIQQSKICFASVAHDVHLRAGPIDFNNARWYC